MSMYEFKCPKCGEKVDVLYKMMKEMNLFEDTVVCSKCKTKMERTVSNCGFRLKGSGSKPRGRV